MPNHLSSQVPLGSIRSGAAAVDTEGHLPRSSGVVYAHHRVPYEHGGYHDLIEAVAAGPSVVGNGAPR